MTVGQRREDKRFRVVLRASSSVQIRSTVEEDPAAWAFDWVLEGQQTRVKVLDVLGSTPGINVHDHLALEVEVAARSLDEAVERGRHLASYHLTMLSLAARAPTGRPEPVLAYDSTVLSQKRAYRGWQTLDGFPVGKVPADPDLVGRIHNVLTSVPESSKRHHALTMAAQFYSSSLRETNPLLRFMLVWLACDAIENETRRYVHPPRIRDSHWGLKAIAESRGIDRDIVSNGYELRNDLFHPSRQIDITLLPVRADELSEQLEAIFAEAILVLYGATAMRVGAPDSPTTVHPTEIIIDGDIEGDEDLWSSGAHPHCRIEIQLRPIPGRPNKPEVDISLTPSNCDFAPKSWQIWGPSGPHRVRLDGNEGNPRPS